MQHRIVLSAAAQGQHLPNMSHSPNPGGILISIYKISEASLLGGMYLSSPDIFAYDSITKRFIPRYTGHKKIQIQTSCPPQTSSSTLLLDHHERVQLLDY
jgi:hypothetical protein